MIRKNSESNRQQAIDELVWTLDQSVGLFKKAAQSVQEGTVRLVVNDICREREAFRVSLSDSLDIGVDGDRGHSCVIMHRMERVNEKIEAADTSEILDELIDFEMALQQHLYARTNMFRQASLGCLLQDSVQLFRRGSTRLHFLRDLHEENTAC